MEKTGQQSEDQSPRITTASQSSYPVRRRRNPAVLIRWIEEHPYNPYPTKAEKHYLAFYAGMTQRQLNDWFANARRNIKKVGYEAWKKKHSGFSAVLSGFPLNGSNFPLLSHVANGHTAAAGGTPISNTDSGYSASPAACLPSPLNRSGSHFAYHPSADQQSNSTALATQTVTVSPIEYRQASNNGLNVGGFNGTQAATILPLHPATSPSASLPLGAVASFPSPFNVTYKTPISVTPGLANVCNGVSSTTPESSEHCSCAQCNPTSVLSTQGQQQTSQEQSQPPGSATTISGSNNSAAWSTSISAGAAYGWSPPIMVPPTGVTIPVTEEANQGAVARQEGEPRRDDRLHYGVSLAAPAQNGNAGGCGSPEGNCYFKDSPAM